MSSSLVASKRLTLRQSAVRAQTARQMYVAPERLDYLRAVSAHHAWKIGGDGEWKQSYLDCSMRPVPPQTARPAAPPHQQQDASRLLSSSAYGTRSLTAASGGEAESSLLGLSPRASAMTAPGAARGGEPFHGHMPRTDFQFSPRNWRAMPDPAGVPLLSLPTVRGVYDRPVAPQLEATGGLALGNSVLASARASQLRATMPPPLPAMPKMSARA